jgi:hypothetical protein
MKAKKLHGSKDRDLEGIKEIAEGFLDINIDDLSVIQKKMLRVHYLENLRDGLKPKEAIENALKVVLCFDL